MATRASGAVSRRMLLASAAALGTNRGAPASNKGLGYSFGTDRYNVEISVEFYDQYSSRSLTFNSGHRFCVSADGEEGRNCIENFSGSLAVAHYRIRARTNAPEAASMREFVRTIDHDLRLDYRAPFERTIELRHGSASDIQVFGYPGPASQTPSAKIAEPGGPWYYFRQDLYLDADRAPFLVIHWRHTYGGIRILDVIPGNGTWQVKP